MDKKKATDKAYRKTHGEEARIYMRKYLKERRLVDESFRLSLNLRHRISNAVSGRVKAGSAVQDLGCSIEFFIKYLESKMLPGMSMKNYGRIKGIPKELTWDIDHIIPLSSFDLTDREQFLKACHYTNLQPMWHIDNIKKGKKIL